MDQTDALLYQGDVDAGGTHIITETFRRTKRVTFSTITGGAKAQTAVGTTFFTRKLAYDEVDATYTGDKYVKITGAGGEKYVLETSSEAASVSPTAQRYKRAEEKDVYTALPYTKAALDAAYDTVMADPTNPEKKLYVGDGEAYVPVTLDKLPEVDPAAKLKPYSYFEYTPGNYGATSAVGVKFYTQDTATKEYLEQPIDSETLLDYYAGKGAPNLYVLECINGEDTYLRVKLNRLDTDPLDEYAVRITGEPATQTVAATSFFVTNVVQEPVLDSDNKPTYDTDGNPITKPKTVYVPYTTTITAANIDDHIGADAPVLYVEREDPIDSSKKVYRKAEIYNLNRDPRVRYEYVPDNFAQVTAVGAEFFTMTETWYDASGNEVDALNPDAVEKKVSYDPLPADHKLGDYLEAEANQLYVKLPGSITRKVTVDKTDTSGNVVLDKDGNPVKVTQNVTTRFANGQDRYVPITLVRVKDEEPEPVPDEYDRYQFRKDLLVSDVRVVTNRQVTFETAIRDPEIAVDDDGNEYLLEPGSYYVDSRTLDWVSQNDPYFLYNDFQYDPSFLQQFGMDNDWILHDTLFAPTYEQDAWQYNEHPWFAATILNSADKLDPSEYTDIVEAQGNLKHAKLVFALHLPSQVTFYDEKMLTDDKKLADSAVGRAAYKYIGDYEDDDYSFYIERNYLDRKDGQMKTERLTPKQLMEKGWTIKISYQPDYGDNSYSQTGTRGKKDNAHYGKADADDPLDTVENRGLVTDVLSGSPEADNGLAASVGAKQAVGSYASVKPARHGKEVVVFEIAAPDDATDREFAEFDSLLNAYYAGAHPDGYLGYGDSMTLKVKTRLDNLGDVDSAMDDSLYEGDALVSYKKQMETIASWDGDESEVYATAHETKLNWIDDEDSEGWDHIYEGDDLTDVNQGQTGLGQKPNGAGSVTAGSDGTVAEGTTGLKPKLTDLKTLIGTSFHGQSVNRFFRAGEKAEDHAVNNVNYDRDSDLDDLYVTDTSGWFRIRKPSASVRADTAKLRSLIYNSDMDVYTGQDVQLRGSNGFYLTQAINTGGAVNSFVVDWQVPFWATASDDPMKGALTVKNAPFTDSEHSDLAVGRILSAFESVSTGIWEVPGAKYDCTYEYKASGSETYQAIELNAKGQYQANVWRSATRTAASTPTS